LHKIFLDDGSISVFLEIVLKSFVELLMLDEMLDGSTDEVLEVLLTNLHTLS
jgi:hypothetical protein